MLNTHSFLINPSFIKSMEFKKRNSYIKYVPLSDRLVADEFNEIFEETLRRNDAFSLATSMGDRNID